MNSTPDTFKPVETDLVVANRLQPVLSCQTPVSTGGISNANKDAP
jgi:hypothetical protein